MKKRHALALLLRCLLAAVFIVSGFQKLVQPAENFAAVIEKYQILSLSSAQSAARALPWIEFVFGAFFLLGFWNRLSMSVLWLLNTAFIFVLGSALLRKLPIENCGCFGGSVSLTPAQTLGIDSLLWIFFLVYFLLNRRSPEPGLDGIFSARAKPR